MLIDLHCAYRWNDESQAADYNAGITAYLDPERICKTILGENLSNSSASDFYSLGVIIFQMLSGQLPFSDESPELLIQSHLNDSTPRLLSHLQAFQPLVEGLMRKDASERIASSSEIRELLNAVNDNIQNWSIELFGTRQSTLRNFLDRGFATYDQTSWRNAINACAANASDVLPYKVP